SGETFGESLGLTRGTISRIENGTIAVTESNIKMISVLFGVSEQWLRNGTGDMLAEKSEADRIIEKLGTTDPFVIEMIRLVMQMSDEHARQILAEVEALAEKYGKSSKEIA
ncbi:MAG: helix-turn-helix domain-containing protein, partial [Clostridiales Family XIII bacterium]|nr:helix-turn-helix domain-containing protein [Clostridiales Family XIII bacterium]